MRAYIGSQEISNGKLISPKGNFSLTWDSPYKNHTIILKCASKIHYLSINVLKVGDDSEGEVIVPYTELLPNSKCELLLYASVGDELKLIDSLEWTMSSNVHSKHDPDEYLRDDNTLSDQQKKYCRCLIHVKAKGSAKNPYAVCAKSVGTTTHCYDSYDPKKFKNEADLQAYKDLHKK